MIIHKLKKMENFTNSEKSIAEYILKNLEDIHTFSAEKLARKSFTSKASVVRLCRKLNVDGYREFQREIDREVSEMRKIELFLSKEPLNTSTKYEDIVSFLPSLYEKMISDTKLVLSPSIMKKIIEKLKKAKKIEIYGTGISYTVAKLAAFKFMTLGIESEAYDGINEHYVVASRKGKNDLAIIISLSSNNPYMIKIANKLKKRKVYVIGIGDAPTPEFIEACSECIGICMKEYVLTLEMLAILAGINYIFDIFFTSLLVNNYHENVNTYIEVMKNGKG